MALASAPEPLLAALLPPRAWARPAGAANGPSRANSTPSRRNRPIPLRIWSVNWSVIPAIFLPQNVPPKVEFSIVRSSTVVVPV